PLDASLCTIRTTRAPPEPATENKPVTPDEQLPIYAPGSAVGLHLRHLGLLNTSIHTSSTAGRLKGGRNVLWAALMRSAASAAAGCAAEHAE
ncbi:MAG TPA: hypothetical protein VFB06_37415, partial [Streptosporangiaceae bacterium]|nr:hypothetical protein [Streptosporangiaceae bacterium]